MYLITVTWQGGVPWDPNEPSSIDPSKKKTPIEHLVATGGRTLDEIILEFQCYKKMPLKIEQIKPEDSKINWITTVEILSDDQTESDLIRDQIIESYKSTQASLASKDCGYCLKVDVSPL